MEASQDIPVESTTTLLANRGGNSHQLSDRVAVLLSSMQTGSQSCEQSTTILILMMLLQNITANTTNGDVIWLAIHSTKKYCEALGVDERVVDEVVSKFSAFSSQVRKSNPLAF
jgi:hypothetical protein